MAKPPKPVETENEAERLAAEQAEAERLAAEQAEQERIAAEQAEIEAARIAAERAAAPMVAREDQRSAIAAFYNIPEAEILDWNVETGNAVTIDGQKLTPDTRA